MVRRSLGAKLEYCFQTLNPGSPWISPGVQRWGPRSPYPLHSSQCHSGTRSKTKLSGQVWARGALGTTAHPRAPSHQLAHLSLSSNALFHSLSSSQCSCISPQSGNLSQQVIGTPIAAQDKHRASPQLALGTLSSLFSRQISQFCFLVRL